MLDPATINLMQAIVRPMPALMYVLADRDRGDVDLSEHAENLRRTLRAMESAVTGWITCADDIVAAFSGLVKANAIGQDDLEWLRETVTNIESGFDADLVSYRRNQAYIRERALIARENPTPETHAIAEIAHRYLDEIARHGRAKVEFVFALRAIESQSRSDSGKGPVFDDPDALSAYLRAAIA